MTCDHHLLFLVKGSLKLGWTEFCLTCLGNLTWEQRSFLVHAWDKAVQERRRKR